MEDILNRFLSYLAVEKGLSRNTILSYQHDLSRYLAMVAGNHPDTILQADIVSFLAHLSGIGIAPASTARNLAAIRGFHKYLLIDGLAKQDPTVNIETPRGWKRLPRTLSAADVETLLEQPDLGTPLGQRDKAMLELLYATGLRVSELVDLRLGNINLTRGFLIVMGKGSKERAVPMGEPAMNCVQDYLDRGRPFLLRGRDSDVLFISSRKKAITRQMFWERIKLYATKAGIRQERFAPYPPSFVRHASARQRRRPSRGPGHARPFRYLDHADLYACFPGTAEEDPREIPSERMNATEDPDKLESRNPKETSIR